MAAVAEPEDRVQAAAAVEAEPALRRLRGGDLDNLRRNGSTWRSGADREADSHGRLRGTCRCRWCRCRMALRERETR